MTTPNDIFTVLGKVEVDLQALRASLSNAEALVQASTNRQAKSYEDFALRAKKAAFDAAMASATHRASANEPYEEGAYAQKFGSGGGGGDGGGGGGRGPRGVENAANKAGAAVHKMHSSMLTSAGGIRGLAHVLNSIVPGLGGMASGILNVARHLGPWGAAVVAAASALAVLHHRMEETAKFNLEMKKSLDSLNFSGIEGSIEKVSDALTFQQDLLRRSNQEINDFGDFMDVLTSKNRQWYATATGEGAEHLTQKLRELSVAWHKLYDSAGGPGAVNAIQHQREAAQVSETVADRSVRLADTTNRVVAAYKAKAAAMDQTKAAELAEIERVFKLDAAKLKGDVYGTQRQALLRDANVKRGDVEAKFAQKAIDNADAEKKALDDVVTSKVGSTNKLIDLDKARAKSALDLAQAVIAADSKMKQSTLDLTKAQVESAARLAQARAKAQGIIVSGSGDISASAAIDRKKIEETEKASQQRFDTEIEGMGKADKKSEEKYNNERANLLRLIENDNEAEKNRQKLDELDKARENEKAALVDTTTKMQKERDADRVNSVNDLEKARIAENEKLTIEQERLRTETIANNISKQAAYWGMRKSMGYDTIQGEIASQIELNKAYKKGTDEYYNGQKKVYDLQKQARDEAKSSAEQAITTATDALKKKFPGRTKFSRSEVEDAYRNVGKEDQKTMSAFGRNEQVDTGELLKGMGRQQGFEKFEAQGGNLAQLFDRAITPPFKGFQESTDDFGDSVKAFREAVMAARDAQAASQSADNQYLRDPSMNQMSESQGRQRLLESRRGPADNPSVS